jgi:hypothetical protein
MRRDETSVVGRVRVAVDEERWAERRGDTTGQNETCTVMAADEERMGGDEDGVGGDEDGVGGDEERWAETRGDPTQRNETSVVGH